MQAANRPASGTVKETHERKTAITVFNLDCVYYIIKSEKKKQPLQYFVINSKRRGMSSSFERVEKADTLSRDKHNHCGKALFCVFPPIPPFQSKTGSTEGFASAHRRFSLMVPLRRRMSACVTISYNLSFFDSLKRRGIILFFYRYCNILSIFQHKSIKRKSRLII